MSLYSRECSFNTYNEVFKDAAGFKILLKAFLLCMGAESVLRRCRHPTAPAWAAVHGGARSGTTAGTEEGPWAGLVPAAPWAGGLCRRALQACSERAAAGQTQEILTVFSLVLSFLPKV